MKKKTIFIFLICLFFLQAFSQVPEKFNYQGILRNSTGNLVENTNITIKHTLLQGNSTGTEKYSESHTTTTNMYGQFSVQVGAGTLLSGSFTGIDWSNDMYLKTEVANPAGGSYTEMGVVQLISVPYSLFANKANEASNIDNEVLYFTDSDTLFAVKDHSGNIVFAVFTDGAKVYVNETAKGKVGGFAVSGRSPTKFGEEFEYLHVTPDSTRIFVNDTSTIKGKVGGFAVSGRSPTKGFINDYLFVTPDSTRIYVNDSTSSKGKVGGFAVSGRSPSKGESSKFLDLTKENYFIGHNAGRNNTSGKFNSIIGYESAINNTEGSDNVFFGYQCGYSNILGQNNVFIGKSAGYNNIGEIQTEPFYLEYGSYNVFIGNNSGYNNISGWTNCFLGNFSGYGNLTGSDNTFIGNFAGESNTIGWENTSLGAFSSRHNLDGVQNVTIGFNSGNKNKGSSNTFIGANSGFDNISGQNNTIIGYNANVSDSSLFNATALGSGTIVNASNKVVIGNSSAITVGGYGNWSNYSDRRLKENIAYKNDLGLRFIMGLKTASYNYKDDMNKRRRDGLIAQDVQQILNDLHIDFSGLIIDNDSMRTMNLSYSDFVVPLINAVQDQQMQIENLKSELEVIRAELKILK